MEKTSTCKLGNHCCTLKLVKFDYNSFIGDSLVYFHPPLPSVLQIIHHHSFIPFPSSHSFSHLLFPVSNSSLSHSTQQPFTFLNSLLYLLMSIPCPFLPLLHLLTLQGGGSYSTGRTECVRDEATERQGGEVCLPGRGQPHDETHHQLTLQKQGGVYV